MPARHLIFIPTLLCGFFNPKIDSRQVFIGASYSSYQLFQDDEDSKEIRQFGVEVGIINIIPKLGIKISGASLNYDSSTVFGTFTRKYIPLTLRFNYNLLPFLKTAVLQLNLETGFGLYLWQGLFNGEVITLPTGEKMDEKDFGFTGGLELQIKPLNNLAIFSHLQYHYLTSSNIYKYGYFDKDEKFFVKGLGLKFFLL